MVASDLMRTIRSTRLIAPNGTTGRFQVHGKNEGDRPAYFSGQDLASHRGWSHAASRRMRPPFGGQLTRTARRPELLTDRFGLHAERGADLAELHRGIAEGDVPAAFEVEVIAWSGG